MSGVVTIVAPVFGTVAIGYAASRGGLFSAETGAGLTRFMYYLAIPALLFRGVAGAALPAQVPWRYFAAFYLPSFAVFWLAARVAGRVLQWPRPEHGIAALTASYANIVLLGLPLSQSAFGDAARLPLFLLVATQSTLMFPLATYTLEIHGQGRRGEALFYLRAAGRLAVNPVIITLLLAFAANLSGLGVPRAFGPLLDLLAAAAPACALVALGISLAQYPLGGGLRDVAVLVLMKNLLCPLLVWLLGRALALEPLWLAVAVLMAAMPAGVNAFIFASQYGLRTQAVAQTIVVSTVVSCLVSSGLLAWLLPR